MNGSRYDFNTGQWGPSLNSFSSSSFLDNGNRYGNHSYFDSSSGLQGLGNLNSLTNQGGDSSWAWGNIFNKDSLLGKGGSILGALQGFGNLYMGMQQYKMGKKALNQSRDQFNKNYEAQRKTTNSALRDRQEARYSANPDAYERPDSYMEKNRI